MARDLAALSLAWLLAALAAPRAAAAIPPAEEPRAAAAAADLRAPLDLVLNGAPRGSVEVILRDGDALVAARDLDRAGLRALAGRREPIDGEEHVSLASLAPALRFEVDERDLALRLTAGEEHLRRTAVDLRLGGRPPGLLPGDDASGFVNYSLQLTSAQRASGFAEAGARHGAGLVYSSGQLLADGEVVRGLSSVTLDDVEGLRRLVAGDAFASTTALGGGVLLGGVSLVREYGLDPYLVRAPLPRLSGFAATPSTLEVYVNGVLTREVPLPPGGYDVTNLPVTAGAGNVEAVLQDAFGRAETLSWQYYYTPALLGRGLSDYGYALGFRRAGFGRTSFAYGRPVLVARHRLGVLDALTLGGRFDVSEDLLSGGPSATFGLPAGTLDLEAAVSVDAGAATGAGGPAALGTSAGAAASAGYSFVSRRFSGGALVRLLSRRYAHAALRAADDRATLQSSVYAGAPVGRRLNVGVSWSLFDRRDGGRSDGLSARADLRLARGVTLGVTGSRTRGAGGAAAYDLLATLSWAFAPMSVADVTVLGGDRAFAGVQRGLPAGTGFGYRARAGVADAGSEGQGALQYQWDHGRYEVQWDRTTDASLGRATLAGGAVFLGDRVFLSRPVEDGFGLIRTGVPGIRGFAEGQEIGRTDARGDLLVPRLLPYYGNRVGIADRDVPIEYSVGRTELLAAPRLRGGVVRRFDVAPLRALEGELVTVSGSEAVPPAYGELSLRTPGGAFSSPVGRDGRFYLEGVPPGSYTAEVAWSGGRCRAALVVAAAAALADAGRVACVPEREPLPVLLAGERSPTPTPTPTSTPTSTSTSTSTSTPTSTATSTATDPEPRTSTSKTPAAADAPAAKLPSSIAAPAPPASPPAAGEPLGFGPASERCPSCAICFSPAFERLASDPAACIPREQLQLEPQLTRTGAAKACLAAADLEEECSACLALRHRQRCPTWGDRPGDR